MGPEPSENGTASDPTSQMPPNGGDVPPSPAPTDGGSGNDTTTPDVSLSLLSVDKLL
jgi:hypothetical protein